ISQALGLFRGPQGWVGMLAYVTALASFAGFAFAFWQLWTSDDVLAALKWGVVALLLFQYAAMRKTFMGTRVEANRPLREIKRMELQVALLRAPAPCSPTPGRPRRVPALARVQGPSSGEPRHA